MGVALCLSGCASSTSTSDTFCLLAKPIPNSMRNVEASRLGIDELNAIGVDRCGW